MPMATAPIDPAKGKEIQIAHPVSVAVAPATPSRLFPVARRDTTHRITGRTTRGGQRHRFAMRETRERKNQEQVPQELPVPLRLGDNH